MLSLASRFSILPEPRPVLLATPGCASPYEGVLVGEITFGGRVINCLVRVGLEEEYFPPAWVRERPEALPANVVAFPARRRP